jgi:hypothetical protein
MALLEFVIFLAGVVIFLAGDFRSAADLSRISKGDVGQDCPETELHGRRQSGQEALSLERG